MSPDDKTSIGGRNERFETTDWTCILRAREEDRDIRRKAVGDLVASYWKPVYCYLRRKGHDNEAAKDLTQGFFEEIVLGRGLIRKAERAKGRFRSFLLKSLELYVRHLHRAKNARKRRPEKGLLSLDGLDSLGVPEPVHDATPEAAFNWSWAASLLDQVLRDVEEQCRKRGEAVHWEVFNLRVLRPIMEDAEPLPIPDICARLSISSAARVSNMIVTVKRRFMAAMARRVRPLVGSDADVDAEIRDLMQILANNGARF